MTAGLRHGLLLLLVLVGASGCQRAEAPQELAVEVFNPHAEQWLDAPVMLRLENYPVSLQPFARVYRNHDGTLREIPSQLDDVDRDGTPDQLFFLVNLDANETARYVVRPDSERAVFPARVSASTLPQSDATREPTLVSDSADARSSFAAVRWASERVEYRVSLDVPGVTDAFMPAWMTSQEAAGTESSASGPDSSRSAYPVRAVVDTLGLNTPSRPAIDVLEEGTVLGLGSPALATRDGFAYLGGAGSVKVDVVADGPLRAIVRASFEDVHADDATLDVLVEREIHAGSRWTEVRLFVTDSLGERRLVTGIPRTPDGPRLQSGSSHGAFYLYTLGKLPSTVHTTVSKIARLASVRSGRSDGGGSESVDDRVGSAAEASVSVGDATDGAADGGIIDATGAGATVHTPGFLAVVLLVPDRFHPRLQPDALLDHRVHFGAENEAASYRYMAAWDEKPEDAMTEAFMQQLIARAAARWMTPVQVSVEY